MCRNKKITNVDLWSWFSDIAENFTFVGKDGDKFLFELKDQFGNVRYTATVVRYTGVETIIKCGNYIILDIVAFPELNFYAYKDYAALSKSVDFTNKLIANVRKQLNLD